MFKKNGGDFIKGDEMPNGKGGLAQLQKPEVKPERVFRIKSFALVQDQYGNGYIAKIFSNKDLGNVPQSSFPKLERTAEIKVGYYRLSREDQDTIRDAVFGFTKLKEYSQAEKEKRAVSSPETKKAPLTEELPPDIIASVGPRKDVIDANKEAKEIISKIARIIGRNEGQAIAFFADSATEEKELMKKIIENQNPVSNLSFDRMVSAYSAQKMAGKEVLQPTFRFIGDEPVLQRNTIPKRRKKKI